MRSNNAEHWVVLASRLLCVEIRPLFCLSCFLVGLAPIVLLAPSHLWGEVWGDGLQVLLKHELAQASSLSPQSACVRRGKTLFLRKSCFKYTASYLNDAPSVFGMSLIRLEIRVCALGLTGALFYKKLFHLIWGLVWPLQHLRFLV